VGGAGGSGSYRLGCFWGAVSPFDDGDDGEDDDDDDYGIIRVLYKPGVETWLERIISLRLGLRFLSTRDGCNGMDLRLAA